jgi:hypothetical protein
VDDTIELKPTLPESVCLNDFAGRPSISPTSRPLVTGRYTKLLAMPVFNPFQSVTGRNSASLFEIRLVHAGSFRNEQRINGELQA